MYQSIDEIELDSDIKSKEQRGRTMIFCLILLGLLCLVVTAYVSSSSKPHPNEKLSAALQERDIYLAAISTPSADMRRARLTDFINSYPNTAHKGPVDALLSTLNRYENDDWATVSYIIFDNDIPKDEKLAALATYEDNWNPLLLGGRESDVARIREILELEPLEIPSRKLEDTIPEPVEEQNSPEPVLVGGAPPPVRAYVPPVIIAEPVAPTIREPVITPSRISRDRKPRYPSRALSRNIDATVVIKMYINERGRVDKTEVVYNSAERYERDFEKAASRAARYTRFYPKTIDGKPVAEIKEKRYTFRLGN